MCVAQVVTCLGRRRVALIRDQNRIRPPPQGAIGLADERAKADKEAQRVERSQAKLKALQNATDSAKAPMRSQDTASDTSTRQKTAKLTDKPASSTQLVTSPIFRSW